MIKMPFKTALKLTAVAALVAVPLGADAHRAWLLPSATVLSGSDNWVTIDAAVSNDLFYFEHMPFRIAGFPQIRINRGGQQGGGQMAGAAPMGGAPAGGAPMGGGDPTPPGGAPSAAQLAIVGPDGGAVEAQNKAIGRYRSTFDVQLEKPGTYRIATTNAGLFASWKENGQTKRWRGSLENLAKEVPEKADDLRVTQSQGRIEVFVTSGKPTTDALKPTGQGLELDPITHPNDLFVGEAAKFRLVFDGKPARKLKVTVIPSGIRYRQNLQEMTLETDEQGEFSVKWAEPGMYWINASIQDEEGPGGRTPRRRANYAATLEVLSQ
ncbi:MAG: DUF4198 domain-containing protein [Rhodospirillales bacterium]|nr:DUF4198 domain-containing protein [Rhodospirillales bacterium]